MLEYWSPKPFFDYPEYTRPQQSIKHLFSNLSLNYAEYTTPQQSVKHLFPNLSLNCPEYTALE